MRLVIEGIQKPIPDAEEIMKKLMKKLEDIMVAVTFAEAGEYDEACSGDVLKEVLRSSEGFKKPGLERAGK